MPIDSNIPLQGRPAAIDAFGAFQQGQAIRQNAMANESGKIVLDQQRGAANDQLLARAARMGASSAADWDAAFGQLAEQVPEAAQYIGQWTPFAAQNLVRGIMPAAPAGGGIGGGRGGGIPAAAGDDSPGFGGGAPGSNKNMQAPTPAGPDLSSLTPEQAKNEYEKLNMALNLLGQVRDAATFDAAIDQFATVVPGVTHLKGRFNELSFVPMNNEPSQFMQWFKTLEGLRDKLQPIATAQAMGVPVRGPQPGYNTQYTEAGPIVATTPVGGGKPSFEFAPVSGNPRKEFLPEPRPARAVGPQGVEPTLSPLALEKMSERVLAGDRTALQNLGRGVQGAANLVALQNKVAEVAEAKGMSGSDIARLMGEFEGFKAGQRSMGTRGANVLMAATEAGLMADLVIETSDLVDRTDYPDLNSIANAIRRGTGDPNIVKFHTALNSFVNIYARAIAPSGQGPTVSDKEHAREMLNDAFAKGQVQGAIDIMLREVDLAKKTPGQVKKAFGEQMGYGGGDGSDGHGETDKPPPKNKPSWAP